MIECPILEKCPFFNDKMVNMPSITTWLKKQYCNNDSYYNCARYSVRSALGPEGVPINLFPNEQIRAKEILQKRQR